MKKESDLITLIVAIYNGEKYLNDCINSLINQTYKNIEIILVNDGSTDNSSQICNNFAKKDSRINVIHKKNHGVSSARNDALKIAHGKYISIIDQDDFVELDYVSYLYKLVKNYNADISLIPHCIIYKNQKNFYKWHKSEEQSEIWTGEYASIQMLYTKVDICPWNKLIKKDLLTKNNINFNENLFGGEGYLFSIDSFMKANKIAVGFKGIYHYRVDNDNSEMSKFRMRTANSSFNTLKLLTKKYSHYSQKLDKALKYANWNVYCYFLESLVMSKDLKQYKDFYKKWKVEVRKNLYVVFYAPIDLNKKLKNMSLCISPKFTSYVLKFLKKGR